MQQEIRCFYFIDHINSGSLGSNIEWQLVIFYKIIKGLVW